MIEDISDWAYKHTVQAILLAILLLGIFIYGGLSLFHRVPWMGFDGVWHDRQVCHMEQQERVETISSSVPYTYTDSKGRLQTGYHTSTTTIHTGQYQDVQVCLYE